MSAIGILAAPLLILFGLWLLARRAMRQGGGAKEAEQYRAWALSHPPAP